MSAPQVLREPSPEASNPLFENSAWNVELTGNILYVGILCSNSKSSGVFLLKIQYYCSYFYIKNAAKLYILHFYLNLPHLHSILLCNIYWGEKWFSKSENIAKLCMQRRSTTGSLTDWVIPSSLQPHNLKCPVPEATSYRGFNCTV